MAPRSLGVLQQTLPQAEIPGSMPPRRHQPNLVRDLPVSTASLPATLGRLGAECRPMAPRTMDKQTQRAATEFSDAGRMVLSASREPQRRRRSIYRSNSTQANVLGSFA